MLYMTSVELYLIIYIVFFNLLTRSAIYGATMPAIPSNKEHAPIADCRNVVGNNSAEKMYMTVNAVEAHSLPTIVIAISIHSVAFGEKKKNILYVYRPNIKIVHCATK